MSLGMVMLTILAVLIYCGVLQRVLDRMHLTDRAALAVVAAMFIGTLLPDIALGRVSVNIGGAVIPLGVCVWLVCKADSGRERLRSVIGALLTGAAVFGMSMLLPDEAEEMLADPNLLYGCAAGVIAWLLGRSRRGAFICGVTGVILADLASAAVVWSRGVEQQLYLGGAGIADAAVLSGVLGVLLCELVGEVTERMIRRRKGGNA